MLSDFLSSLFEEGRVQVPRPTQMPDRELGQAERMIAAFEQEYRQELPAVPPDVCLPAACWAAQILYRACQFAVFRDVGDEIISRTLAGKCPEGDPFSVHYSVDLTFRFLPDLFRLAHGVSPGDPLLTELLRLAGEWPLSSVGVAGIDKVEIEPWSKHPCLMGLYVDRVIAAGAVSRLSDPLVREAVRQALGAFPDLAPKIAAALADYPASQDCRLENVP